MLFEFWRSDGDGLKDIIANYPLVVAAGFDVCILASCDRGFGYHRKIHVWLTPLDYENSSLMILLSYILLGHPEWKKAEIMIFSLVAQSDMDDARQRLAPLINSGRLPISAKNIRFIPNDEGADQRTVINTMSRDADLTVIGFRGEVLKRDRAERANHFAGYDDIGMTLFVNTVKEITIVAEDGSEAAAAPISHEADAAKPKRNSSKDLPPANGEAKA